MPGGLPGAATRRRRSATARAGATRPTRRLPGRAGPPRTRGASARPARLVAAAAALAPLRDERLDGPGDLLRRGHERQVAGEVFGVVAERGLGVREPDVIPAAVLAPLDDHGGPVALVVPEVLQVAANAEASAARFVAVAADVPDDDARGLDSGGDGRDVGVVCLVVGHPGGPVQPLGLVDLVPAGVADERDRHRADLGRPGDGVPPVAAEVPAGLAVSAGEALPTALYERWTSRFGWTSSTASE